MSALSEGQAGLYRVLQNQAVALSLGSAGIVFLVDLWTPLGVASGVPYSLAVLLSLNASSRRYVVGFAVLCSVLTISDLFIGPSRGGSEVWKVLTNRSLALCMIWITSLLGMARRQADERRCEAEERTRLHLADLAHMSRVKTAGQLAATLAHELNQPLAAISFQSEFASYLVESNGDADPHLVGALKEVTDQSHRAADIIRGVRNLVRKGEPEQSRVQLNEIVRDVTKLTDTQFRRRDVDLQLSLDEMPEILANRIQIEQVMLNLLQNSLDAVGEKANGSRRVVVETQANGSDCIEVRVRDTGVGLRSDEAEQVFKRFYSAKPKGMGMGLALSRSIIEAHGGRLWAEANEGTGATFRFCLPKVT